MILDRIEIATTLNQIQTLIGDDKAVPGLLLNIHDSDIDVCFSNGNKTFIKNISKQTEDNDISGIVVFNFKAFKTAIDACEPIGIIETKSIQIVADTEASVKIVAEKVIPLFKDGEKVGSKVASVVEQRVGFDPEEKAKNNVKLAVLFREKYDLLKPFDDEYISEKYAGMELDSGLRPMTFSEWEENRDEWDKDELCTILTKLSSEKGKIMYISPRTKLSFVQNTSTNVSIPVKSDIKHINVLPTMVSKGLADTISKQPEDKIYTHMIDKHKMAFVTEDAKFAVMVTNLVPDKNQIAGFNAVTSKQYTNCMVNLNKDVMLSTFKGAKVATATDKVELKITADKDEDGKAKELKLTLEITNSGSSTSNKYDLMPEFFIIDDEFTELSLNVNLQTMIDAINRTDSEYITLDIHNTKSKAIRVAGIDTKKMTEVKEAVKQSGAEWTDEQRRDHRNEYIGVTTYFAA